MRIHIDTFINPLILYIVLLILLFLISTILHKNYYTYIFSKKVIPRSGTTDYPDHEIDSKIVKSDLTRK